jgi:diguanylate cyclase (GGDEF)-like protein/PAS domain S-box-containing protein
VGDGVIATDQHGQIEIINEVAQRLTGWSEAEALGRPFEQVFVTVDEQTWEKQEDSVGRVLHSGITIGLTNHTVLLAKDGNAKHIADSAAPIKDDQGLVSGAVLVFRDVTEEKAQAAEIEYLSYHDQLTGLYNRRFLERALKKLDTAHNLPISIVMSDLNGLKLVNDTLGHAIGDQLLRKAAEVVTANCRDSDIIARWGGDEFILLLPRTDSVEAEIIVSRIEQSLQMETVESLLVSMSFGWGTKTESKQEIGSVFRRAENHMYRSKLFQSPGIRSETIDALMAALFEKNQREEEHSHRVSDLCQLVGKALGLNDWKVKELGLIGLFHDIGKIVVDESTLNKSSDLSEDEWKELRRHPEVGYRLLSAVQDMSDIASYVLAHHERWDGTGYPKGLKAEEIPLESRIIGIADAYDAMVSYRPYRKSLSKIEAIEELRRHAGTQFDPRIAEIFIAAIEDWEEHSS